MRLSQDECLRRFAGARVLRLGTVDDQGRPHLVPATFAVWGEMVVTAVDHKPKRHTDLKRLRNIRAHDRVSALVDHYEDDWDRLWWVRADGTARILDENENDDDENERGEALDRLVAKYPQYAGRPPEGPVIGISVSRWTGWAWTGGSGP